MVADGIASEIVPCFPKMIGRWIDVFERLFAVLQRMVNFGA